MDTIHKLITDRWSPVSFATQDVEYEKIHLLFEAAKWAPSARNAQPWRFIYTTREMSDYKVFLDLMSEANQLWASAAPLLVLPLAQVISTYKERPNRLAYYETGMAVGNLLVQATALGLMAHQLGGYDVERAREILRIPTRFEPMSMIAIGYEGDHTNLPPDKVDTWNKRDRSRMETSEFVVRGSCM